MSVWVTGETFSPPASFPISAGAYQPALGGLSDAFVSRMTYP